MYGERIGEGKEMRLASKLCSILILTVLLASMCATVYATQSIWVSIQNPGSTSKGLLFNPYWVGEIPIRIADTQAGASSGAQTNAYCMQPAGVIYIGSTYQADITSVPDDATWKAISYILTWYNPPSTPADGVRNQVAIWKLLGGYSKPSWLSTSYDTAGESLKTTATGMDVVRQSDTLSWISPLGLVDNGAVRVDPGQSIYFAIQLMNGANPRPNVKITFSAGSLISPTDVFTDSQGKAGVTVNIPSDWPQGSTVEITASTRGVWPRVFLNLNSHEQGTQNLIGIDTTYDLTVEANACVLAHINMVPEIPLGTLAAASMMALGFMAWNKKKGKSKASVT
jgi:hypothetical protein